MFSLLVAIIVLVVTAFSFGLGQRIQNLVVVLDVIASLVWLWLIWRGKFIAALIGISATLITGVVILPFLSR